MTKQHEHASNFWFGFAFGAVALAAGSFFLGAKDGRDFLKRLLEFTEDLEKNLENLQDELHEESKKIESQGSETFSQMKDSVAEKLSPSTKPKPLENILEKIHSLSPTKSLPERFIKPK